MEPAKLSLLFGDVPDWADPDDPEDRAALLAEQLEVPEDATSAELLRLMIRETIATQIAEEDPPEVWATAQRLTGAGLAREAVLSQLNLALLPRVSAAVGSQEPFDHDAYIAALAHLPVPSAGEIEDVVVSLVRRHQPIGIDDLEEMAAAELGMAVDEEPGRSLMDRVTEGLTDPDGPLVLLWGDRVVDPVALCAGAVLTHRLTDAERDIGYLAASVDLAGFNRLENPLLASDRTELEPVSAEEGHVAWRGPEGWLEEFPAEALLAVRAVDGAVQIEVLDADPDPDPDLVAALRDVYDAAVEEPGLPVAAEELVCGLLADDPTLFATPQAPLRQLIAAAGLELRGSEVAHEPGIWANARTAARIGRVLDRLDRPQSTRALEVLEAYDSGTEDPEVLRQALLHLAEPEVADTVAVELLDADDPGPAEEVATFADALIGAARQAAETAPARWLAALAAERAGDLAAAEAQLQLAVGAAPGWEPAVDRAAWYLSDRGRAADAVRLWRSVGVSPASADDLATIEPLTRVAGAKLGRNEACWCGSGRKYKVCHLGQPPSLPLPDRVGWLARKAVAYLERAGRDAQDDVFSVALARAGSTDPDLLEKAMADPVVIDLTLTEGGWFARFLEERGALLPDDEALLAAAWALVDRTVYEIIDVRSGEGITLRDLRSAEVAEVTERTFSRQARPGTLICARAVPDGRSHQLVGGVFSVPAGREAEVLDLLDDKDPEAIAEYVGALERPPTLVTRDNEPMVICRAVLAAHPKVLRDVLDTHYEPEGDETWVEMHTLGPDERILRATLQLAGGRLTVETMSEPRMERVLERLQREVPDITVVSDVRRPLEPGEMPPLPRHIGAASIDPADMAGAMEAVQDQMERRWCEEVVPALGGLTPRQAAADPTRRETLERLLTEFEQRGGRLPPGGITMRPDRIRELLGLRD